MSILKDTISSKVIDAKIIKQPTFHAIKISNRELQGRDVIFLQNQNSTNTFKDVLPFLTLILGIFLNRGIDRFTQRKEIKKTGERWRAELHALENPIQQQIKNLINFIEQSNDTSLIKKSSIHIVSLLDCSVFITLDKYQLIKYLEKFKNRSYYDAIADSNSVHSVILVLKSDYENLINMSKQYIEEISIYLKYFQTDLEEFINAFSDYGLHIDHATGEDANKDPRFKQIADLFNRYIKPDLNKEYKGEEMELNFFKPVLSILGPQRFDEKINSMVQPLKKCVKNINLIKNEKRMLERQISILIERYHEDLGSLKRVIKLLD